MTNLEKYDNAFKETFEIDCTKLLLPVTESEKSTLNVASSCNSNE